MNATTLSELRHGVRDMADEKMDQVRELLFGEEKRRTDATLARLEARIHDLELTLLDRIGAIEKRIEALAGETTGQRKAAFEELARSVAELSGQIDRIARG